MALTITWAEPADAGEILTLQRAAYVTEAQLYGDPFIAPLVESLQQMRKAIEAGTVMIARLGARIVGALRASRNGRTCVVSRLVVAPDVQQQGIGSALLIALEAELAPDVDAFDVFTGHLSNANLRLLRRFGYKEASRERVHDHLTLVHLRKRG